jgi:Flp pilus assembly protein TadB
MSFANHRLSRPVYEGLPWVYLLGGLLALIASYFQTSSTLSVVLGLPGFLVLMAGAVVLLRRRAYRRLRAQYDAPEALDEAAAAALPAGHALPDTGTPRD